MFGNTATDSNKLKVIWYQREHKNWDFKKKNFLNLSMFTVQVMCKNIFNFKDDSMVSNTKVLFDYFVAFTFFIFFPEQFYHVVVHQNLFHNYRIVRRCHLFYLFSGFKPDGLHTHRSVCFEYNTSFERVVQCTFEVMRATIWKLPTRVFQVHITC